MLHALDRGILPGELKNGERPVAGLIPPGLPGSRGLPFVTQDLARAQQERALVKAPETVLELIARDTPTDRTVARWLTESLMAVKVRLLPRFEKEAQYLARLRQGKFKLALTILAAESASSVHGLRSFSSGARLNWGGWTHVPFDTLLSDADRTSDQKETARLAEEASRILEAQEAAVVGLGYPAQSFLLGHRVISFATTPFGAPDLVKVQLKR
jgi:ABC-type oligopeptide transport system substrate-binding subunit